MNELVKLTARQAVSLLQKGQITPVELVDAAADRIAEVEPLVNALPTTSIERAREEAQHLMRTGYPKNPPPGYLFGLPLAIKDLKDVEGVRSTRGSPIYANFIPTESDHLVKNIESKGGLVIAKSNTPEFGAGANTFNEVFGKTRNPWDTSKTCGGSSGGSAVALATGEVWGATGSDLGGSLRIPASFCAVVGLRPSPGRVAHGPKDMPFGQLSVEGPMARNVGDVALLLDSQAGLAAIDPISLPAPTSPFVEAVDYPIPPVRVAFTTDLGIAPVNPEVRTICTNAVRRFEDFGATIVEATIDLHDAEEIFQTMRAAQYAAQFGPLLAEHRDLLKQDIVWNIEKGQNLSMQELSDATIRQGALYNRTVAFFKKHDLLVSPTVLVPPFDINQAYITEVEGTTFDNYVSWLIMSFALTLTACPSISVPCGFTTTGLPVGLQITAPRAQEASLLSAAALFEGALGFDIITPIDPIVRHLR